MRIRLRTRLWASLFALVGVLAATAAVVLVALRRVSAADHAAAMADHAKHLGHNTAALVRDIYIHQTHVSIGGDASHLDHYTPIVARARAAAGELLAAAGDIGLGAAVGPLDAVIGAIDHEFRSKTLPAVGAGDRAAVTASHAAVEALVDGAVGRIEQLNRALEAHAEGARAAAVSAGRNAVIAIMSALGIAAVLALLFGARLARLITAPLDALEKAAARLAGGDRAARVTPAGDREIAALGEAFNRMAEDIERNEQRLVEARKLAALGQLAAGVAHEINNPLTVVLGRTRLLRNAVEPGGMAPELAWMAAELDAVAAEAQQCHRIVADLLSLGQPRPTRPERIDLKGLLGEAVLRARATARAPAGEDRVVEVLPVPAAPGPVADPVRLRQIVDNLLRNAVEASRSRVRVKASESAGGWTIEVDDDGPGVPAAELPRVFEPFFTTKTGGTGLGLAVSLAAARTLGGDLRAGRAGADLAGARFVLFLPAAAPGTGAERAEPRGDDTSGTRPLR